MKIVLNQPYSFCQLGHRDNQEDCRYPDADEPANAAPFFLVCDGVGGCDKGEVASRTVCESFGRSLSRVDWEKPFSVADFKTALNQSYSALRKVANNTNRDMATTLTFAALHQGGCTVAHIGDSRIYHIRPRVGILYRSDDHSLVNALVHSGNLTPEEAINHPDSNIITRYICVPEAGKELSDATVLQIKDLQADDYIFLCSDGVLHQVSDDTLQAILAEDVSDREKMNRLSTLCAESEDNNTAYLIPIKEVVLDDDEHEEDSARNSGADTKTFTHPQEQARDVSPENSFDLRSRISDFFKKLF